MKKRIITLLAVLALLVTCAVFAVQAAGDDAATTPTYIDLTAFKCPCSACAAARETNADYVLPVDQWVTYTEGMNVTAVVDGGHYYYKADLSPGSSFSIKNKEVVLVLDNMTMNIGGTGRAMLIGAGTKNKLHIIGNNAVLQSRTTSTTATAGAIGQIYSGGELHLYGGITIQKGTSKLPSADSGLFRMPNSGSSLLYLHASTGMGLPANAGDPVLNGADLSATGSSSNVGGVTYLQGSSCTFTMEAGTVNGAKTGRGGALGMKAGKMNILGGTVNGGYAVNRGGAIYVEGGTLNIGGTAKIKGYTGTETGTIYRAVCVGGGTCNLFGNAEIISSNKGDGDGVMVTGGTLTIDGSATVKNTAGTANNNIWHWAQDATAGYKGVIRIDKDWNGTASVYMNVNATVSHGGFFGYNELVWGVLDDTTHAWTANTANFSSGERSGLRIENSSHDYPSLYFFAYTDSKNGFMSGMVVPRAQLIEGKAETWYLTPSASVLKRCAESEVAGAYVKLWANYDLPVGTNEVTVDLNGINVTKTVTIDEGGKLFVFDSKAKAGEAGAAISAAAEPITQIGGKTYVFNNGKIYPVELKVNGVSLRPSATQASMYYSAKIVAHQDAGIDSFGMAVALNDSNVLEEHLYTAETDTTKLDAFNSVLVNGVVKNEATDNADRAAQKVYAKAYIKVGDAVAMSTAADYSLNSLVSAIAKDPQYADRLTEIAAYDWYSALVIEE